MLECVPNVSEGRDRAVVHALAEACGYALLDVHTDPDHHRSVFTLGSNENGATENAVRGLAAAVARHVDVSLHRGVHPRLGALDVVPFVALPPFGRDAARAAALDFARWWSGSYEVPVYLYDDADPERRPLPALRREAFAGRSADFGPDAPHPRLGATAVGCRRPLVAVNCLLADGDLGRARRIAGAVREAGGGLPGVRALGFGLESQGRAQVSLNLTDLDRTGLEAACRRVDELARAEGTGVARIELVGLVPQAELARCSEEFLRWSGLDERRTIETRLAGRASRPRARP